MKLGSVTQIPAPTGIGTGQVKDDRSPLSHLIYILNERFGTEFEPGDQIFYDSIREDALASESLQQAARANTMQNFGIVSRKAL